MRRLNLAFRTALILACMGWWVFLGTRPTPAPRPVGPQDYTAVAVELDGGWITIRNTGGEVLTDCQIEFTAGLGSPGGARYEGHRYYPRWEPGRSHEIGISTSRGPMEVVSVRFTGRASAPNKGPGYWRLAYPAGAEDG